MNERLATGIAVLGSSAEKQVALWCLYAAKDNPYTTGTFEHIVWEEKRREARAIGEYYASKLYR